VEEASHLAVLEGLCHIIQAHHPALELLMGDEHSLGSAAPCAEATQENKQQGLGTTEKQEQVKQHLVKQHLVNQQQPNNPACRVGA
jgi:hypothetical protein